jgi:hypothetical protein
VPQGRRQQLLLLLLLPLKKRWKARADLSQTTLFESFQLPLFYQHDLTFIILAFKMGMR